MCWMCRNSQHIPRHIRARHEVLVATHFLQQAYDTLSHDTSWNHCSSLGFTVSIIFFSFVHYIHQYLISTINISVWCNGANQADLEIQPRKASQILAGLLPGRPLFRWGHYFSKYLQEIYNREIYYIEWCRKTYHFHRMVQIDYI